jgi:hypothetical protein
MAKLKAVIEKLEDVAEPLRELYTKGEDGKFHLDAEGVEDVGGLKKALDSERKRAREFEKKLKDLPEGFDPEQYAELLKLQEEFKKGQLSDKQREEFDSLKKQLQDAHAKELGKRDERVKQLTAALEEQLITSRATQAIATAKGSIRLLLPHVRSQAKVVEQDGKFTAVIVDKDGHTRIGDKGQNLTFEALVAEMKDQQDFAGAFEGSGASGSGALGNRGPGTPAGALSFEDLVKNPGAAIAAANTGTKK